MHEDYALDHLNTIRTVIGAFRAAYAWLNLNPEKNSALIYDDFGYPPAVVERISQHRAVFQPLDLDASGLARLQGTADWLAQRQVIPGQIDASKYAINLQDKPL